MLRPRVHEALAGVELIRCARNLGGAGRNVGVREAGTEFVAFTTWLSSSLDRAWAGKSTPGRYVVHRLNRVEYRNTIRELLGIDFNTEMEFPPDDTGHGFDSQTLSSLARDLSSEGGRGVHLGLRQPGG